MTIADIQEAALCVHRKVNNRTRSDIRQIHVAAVVIRLQRGNGFYLRRNSDGADEWFIRQNDLVAPAHTVLVDVHFPDALGQGRIEQRRRRRSDESSEFRYDAGRAGRLCPPCLHSLNMHSQAVALLHALDGNRSALRVEKWKI